MISENAIESKKGINNSVKELIAYEKLGNNSPFLIKYFGRFIAEVLYCVIFLYLIYN